MRIAKQLMEDKIPITRVKGNTECDVNYYSWGAHGSAISCGTRFTRAHILSAGRTRKESAPIPMTSFPVRNGEVLEGCHEAIVSPEDWEKVQELIDRRPPSWMGTPALL